MNKKISFLIAIIIIVICAVLVGGIIAWQYFGMSKAEEEISEDAISEEISSQQEDSMKIIIGDVQGIDDTLGNSILISGGQGAYLENYKSYEHEFEIKYPVDARVNGWIPQAFAFGLCRKIQELKESSTLYGSYCLYSSVLYLDDEYINYDWDKESIKDFNIKGYWEYDYLEEDDMSLIVIAIDDTKKIITDSGEVGHVGIGRFGIESDEFSPLSQKFVIFPLKSKTKVLILSYFSLEEFEEMIGKETGIEIKEETKIEIEKTINKVFSTFRFIEIEGQCRYGKSKYEMRIYDSQGRVTGLVNGEVKEEIPDSFYHEEYYVFPFGISTGIYPQTINIFDPEGLYIYEIFGLTKGSYKFNYSFATEGKIVNFYVDNIPIFPEETHQYHFDWEVLRQGKDGVTLFIDSNNDSVFEKTIKSDRQLTCEEFIKELE